MKVLHVTPSFYPATHWGGPMSSLYGLCNAIARNAQVELRVLTTDTAGPRFRQRLGINSFPMRDENGYLVYYCRRIFGASFSPGLLVRLWPMIRWADIVHLTAVYSSPTIPTLLFSKMLGKKLVWSPRGSFTDWIGRSRSGFKRSWNLICDQLCNVDRVALHFTSETEKEQGSQRIRNASIALIPNGVDSVPDSQRRIGPNGNLRLLFLGRLHPIKGLENLFSAIAKLNDNVTLAVSGDGSSEYRSKLQGMVEDLGLGKRVTFTGAVPADSKAKVFQEADVCVLPSFSENFGMAIAESLAHGVPVIASKNTPWHEVENVGCGLWVENDPEHLAMAIETIKTMPLAEMGDKGRAWMLRDFSWDKRAEDMLRCYRRLLENE